MLELTKKERAKLYLAMTEALGVPDHPETVAEVQRAGLAELVAGWGHDDAPIALHEVYRLAEAVDHHLTYDAGVGPYGFSIANVAAIVGGDKNIAKAALKLLGARPTWRTTGKDDWSTDPSTIRVESVRFPPDLLVTFTRLELEEVKEAVTPTRRAA